MLSKSLIRKTSRKRNHYDKPAANFPVAQRNAIKWGKDPGVPEAGLLSKKAGRATGKGNDTIRAWLDLGGAAGISQTIL